MAECMNCGKGTGRNKYFCSQRCRVQFYEKKNTRICPICGRGYSLPPSEKSATCGRKECASIHRKNTMPLNTEDSNIARINSYNNSPHCGAKETSLVAKSWVIKSPDGKIYELSNLALWAREHENILPSSAKLFTAGIRDIKRGRLLSYKGWTIVKAFDTNISALKAIKGKSKPRKARQPKEEKLKKRREYAHKIYHDKKRKGE